MRATVQDLRDALADAAEQASPADGLTTLQAVERGVGKARRRTVVGVCSLAVAAIGVGGAVALGEGRKDAATPSGPQAPGALRVVSDDPAFPVFDRGLRRMTIVDLPMGAEGSVELPPVELLEGRRIYALRYCTGTHGSAPAIRLVSGSQVRYLDCPTRTASASTGPSALWYPEDASLRMAISARSATPGEGNARIAFYQEASWEQYALPPRPVDLDSNPAYAWRRHPAALAFVGPADPGAPNLRRTLTVAYQERMGIGIQARGPGSLTLRVNGTSLDLFCGQPGRIAVCVPEQTIGDTFTTWGYGYAEGGVWFDSLAGLEVGKALTITVDPAHFQGDDWRLEVGIRER